MKRISSFEVDHTVLEKGMYLSRTDGDIVTYDLRFCTPNSGDLLENDCIHTIEHLFATFARSSPWQDRIIYFGPMGCRTGFYFIVRNMSHEDVIALTKEALLFISAYEGDIPGASKVECGNYTEHNLKKARRSAQDMVGVLNGWIAKKLSYRKQ